MWRGLLWIMVDVAYVLLAYAIKLGYSLNVFSTSSKWLWATLIRY